MVAHWHSSLVGAGQGGRHGPVHEPAITPRFAAGLRERIKGPGGYYNVGNAIGLIAGLFVQLRDAGEEDLTLAEAARSLEAYFIGNWAAVALTLATIVFFWSGEEYHRARGNDLSEGRRRIRRGDLLSGIGAVFLGAGLFVVGEPLLAATSGLLHAAGKFGSAVDLRGLAVDERSASTLRDLFRWSVVVSRVPAIAIALTGLAAFFGSPDSVGVSLAMISVTLLVCYALWAKADLMLLKPMPRLNR